MSANKKSVRKQIRKILKPTVGKLLGILMAAYFVFTFISYKDRVQVSYYEVEEGSLVKEHNYTGLILREEKIVSAEANGYIYYYVADGRKAAKGSPVYSIDEGGQLMNYLTKHSDELTELNSARVADIRAEILHYSRTFEEADFRNLYNIQNTLDAHSIEYASMNIFSSITDDLVSEGINFKEFDTDITGVVCCYTDGYESVTEADLKESLFEREQYDKKNIKAGDLVSIGDPAYKMILDENWEIAFPMTDDDVEEFKDENVIKVSFSDKGFSSKCKLKIVSGSDGRKYGIISLDSYLVQFTSDRFVDFEIVTNDVSGLKIPDKSVTTKDFYIIPVNYLITDDKGNKGFYKAIVGANGTAAQFIIPEIFNVDSEYCYIDCNDNTELSPGDFVMSSPEKATAGVDLSTQIESAAAVANEDAEAVSTAEAAGNADVQAASQGNEDRALESTAETSAGETAGAGESTADTSDVVSGESKAAETSVYDSTLINSSTSGLYQISAKKSLEGVYNVNKGYAVFRMVDILETANGYTIIRKNVNYGLQVYDHIVLDATTVHDGQILYR
ncbi:MAG: HlyD family efflux transporter periplasmic adaptor subunit [Eubacteriales bacterium]|nr:HlyD family efflux transporter periplasmic adaptor subunit [Eubacteriales bacterium]